MALIVRTPRIRHVRRRSLDSFKYSRRFMAWLEYHADRTSETVEDLFDMIKAGGAYAVERLKQTFLSAALPFGAATLYAEAEVAPAEEEGGEESPIED